MSIVAMKKWGKGDSAYQIAYDGRSYLFADEQGESNLQVDLATRNVRVSSILDWFDEDFGPTLQKTLASLAKYMPDGATRRLIASADFSVSYQDSDWSLNKQ